MNLTLAMRRLVNTDVAIEPSFDPFPLVQSLERRLI
jgi:hypothetical protein